MNHLMLYWQRTLSKYNYTIARTSTTKEDPPSTFMNPNTNLVAKTTLCHLNFVFVAIPAIHTSTKKLQLPREKAQWFILLCFFNYCSFQMNFYSCHKYWDWKMAIKQTQLQSWNTESHISCTHLTLYGIAWSKCSLKL